MMSFSSSLPDEITALWTLLISPPELWLAKEARVAAVNSSKFYFGLEP